jgi:hypothetical protein
MCSGGWACNSLLNPKAAKNNATEPAIQPPQKARLPSANRRTAMPELIADFAASSKFVPFVFVISFSFQCVF